MSSTSSPARVSALLSGLSGRAYRCACAVLGAVCADAAARPLHWVYDANAMREHLRGREDQPEFHPENRSPYYKLETGGLI